MTFNLDKLVVLGGQGKQGEAFQSFGYVSTDDKVDVEASDYFNELKGKASVNDTIQVINNSGDGENLSYLLKVSSITVQGVVSVTEITPTYTGGDVDSVFGRNGDVVAVSGDYDASQVTNAFDKTGDDSDDINEGSTNLFYTEARVSANTDVAANTVHRGSDGKDHSDVVTNTSNIGTNTTNIGTNTTDIGVNAANIAAINQMDFPIGYKGLVSNDSIAPDEQIDITAVKCYDTLGTTYIEVGPLADFDITLNASWASGTAPSLTDASIFVWAVYDATTPYYILDDATGSNIIPAKRRVDACITDSSGDIIPFVKTALAGGGVLTEYLGSILESSTGPIVTFGDYPLSIPDGIAVIWDGYALGTITSGLESLRTTLDAGTTDKTLGNFEDTTSLTNYIDQAIDDANIKLRISGANAFVTFNLVTQSYTDERTA